MRATLALASTLALLASAGPGWSQRGPERPNREDGRPRHDYANPSALISAEVAMSHLARNKGQWTAFLATAAPDAVVFAPQQTKAADWLRRRSNPPVALRWQPYQVWMSCDGSYGATRGAWQQGPAFGAFVTIWQRQNNGDYKWVSTQRETLVEAQPAPEMIEGKVADCVGLVRTPRSPPGPGVVLDMASGRSDDGSLAWSSVALPNGVRQSTIMLRQDGRMRAVAEMNAPAPGANQS